MNRNEVSLSSSSNSFTGFDMVGDFAVIVTERVDEWIFSNGRLNGDTSTKMKMKMARSGKEVGRCLC